MLILSDESIKEQIRPLEDSDGLFELSPKSYQMKGGKKKNYGFIAQDVEKTSLKEIVYKNDKGIRSLAMVQLIPILVDHIQKLTNRVEELEKRP